MSIKIELEITPEGREDLYIPRFFCDYCERAIENIGMGMMVWSHPVDPAEPRETYTVHKRACDRAFHDLMGWEDSGWEDLSAVLGYLGHEGNRR